MIGIVSLLVFTVGTINEEGIFEKGVELIVIGEFPQTML